MKKFALILSGCGVYDGSEIHEATLSMLAISKNGATYDIYAPDIDQHHVINHLNGEVMAEKRNVLVESARIARGKIKPLRELNPAQYDAILLPGGFGAAKNLSSFAFDGPALEVNELLASKLREANKQGKAIAALCIAPVILAKVFEGAQLTIGNDAETADAIAKLGAKHIVTKAGGVTHDTNLNIFTTPCYMLDGKIEQVAESCDNIVKAILEVV